MPKNELSFFLPQTLVGWYQFLTEMAHHGSRAGELGRVSKFCWKWASRSRSGLFFHELKRGSNFHYSSRRDNMCDCAYCKIWVTRVEHCMWNVMLPVSHSTCPIVMDCVTKKHKCVPRRALHNELPADLPTVWDSLQNKTHVMNCATCVTERNVPK